MMALRFATGIRSHFVTRLPEWILSTGLLVQSFNLLRRGDSFSTSPVYRLLAKYVSDNTWGWIAFTISVVWLLSLAINGSFRSSRRWTPWVRSIAAMSAGAYWITNTLAVAAIASTNPGVVNNMTLGAAAIAFSILIAREVGRTDILEAKRCQTPNRLAGRP